MRRVAVWLVILVVFSAGLVASFPTGRLVSALLARLPPDTARVVERIGSSHLGLGGLTLEDVRLRPRPDAPPLELRTLSVRPSLLGVLRGRRGRPWRLDLHGCAGTATATLDRQADDDTLDVQFANIDLVACLAPLQLHDGIEGRATGDAKLVRTPAARTWAGVLELAEARWQAPNTPRHLALLGKQVSMHWRLDDVFHIDDFALANDEFSAQGSGVVEFPPAPARPELDLRVRLQPSAAMPQAHRDLLNRLPGSPPDAAGARTYRLGGPLDAPRLGAP